MYVITVNKIFLLLPDNSCFTSIYLILKLCLRKLKGRLSEEMFLAYLFYIVNKAKYPQRICMFSNILTLF